MRLRRKDAIMQYRARLAIGLTIAAGCALIMGGFNAEPLVWAQESRDEKGRQRDEAVIQLEPVTVTGRAADLVGVAGAASQGQVGQTELDTRPLLRPGEVLEVIPGLAVTQHSGTGKANQYFLRGFNLDHGTDFSTFIDGMPVNFPTHAHGQGYMDLNFLIPEIIDAIDYKKGPYYAEVGDFSSAGSADLHLFRTLPDGFAKCSVGEDDYYRLVLAHSPRLGPGTLLCAFEGQYYDGPWDVPQRLRKFNGVLKYRQQTRWLPKFRTVLGLRGDIFVFDVESDTAVNSGLRADNIVSPKLSLIFGPWASTEIYLNGGFAFHSNDARGTTITVDPQTGERADRVDPLVRSKGAEIGVRSTYIPGLHTTVACWYLELDSELLFVGDAGITEPSRPSRRYGVEWTNFYRILPWLTLDADFAFTRAKFTDDDPAGDHIPGAFATVIAAGATVDLPYNLFGSLRVRHFGPRPLIEDNSVKSDPTTLVNLEAGYKYKQYIAQLDVLNLLNSQDHDIDYFYKSRLPGEPGEGRDDIHFHPVEPRTVRFSLTYKF